MDWHDVAVSDLNAAELEFTLTRVRARRAQLAGRLAAVALRNRVAALGAVLAGAVIGAAPLLLLPVLPAAVVGLVTTAWLVVLVRILSRHRGLNGLIAAWRAEERDLREQLAQLGGQAAAIEARLQH